MKKMSGKTVLMWDDWAGQAARLASFEKPAASLFAAGNRCEQVLRPNTAQK